MNVEIGTEATEFPEKEYINGIFVAVQSVSLLTKYQGLGYPNTKEVPVIDQSPDDSRHPIQDVWHNPHLQLAFLNQN